MSLKSLATLLLSLVYLACLFVPFGAAQADRSCDPPPGLHDEISKEYPSTRVVTPSDLSDDDRELFKKDHGNTCPGLVNVDFYGDGKPTVALVLLGRDGAKQRAELVLAHQVGDSWSTALLETAKDSVPAVWSQAPGTYRDVYGEKELRATRSVLAFCQYNAWAILYAWVDKRVSKVWLLD
jgi:hypothetical protein